MLDNVTVPKIGNTNVIDLAGGCIESSYNTLYASNCTFTGGNGIRGGAFYVSSGVFNLTNCIISGNTCPSGSGVTCAGVLANAGSMTFSNVVITGNTDYKAGQGGPYLNAVIGELYGCEIAGNAGINYRQLNGSMYISGCILQDCQMAYGGTISFAGSNTLMKGVVDGGGANSSRLIRIEAGTVIDIPNTTYGITAYRASGVVVEPGGCVVNNHTVAAGTYTVIYANGTTS